jgi:UDP-N-acetylglucosamine--N-acetylmuramyl-(pentapeptide) pyrophosphoryl-undecaprenol N-acetylglucosamine transferase
VQLPKAFAAHSVALDVWHQTGKGHQQSVQRQYQENNFPAKVSEFIEDMAGAYKWADFLVCRAGAMTIAECCAAGKPALLVPYPHSAGNHQDRNADFMVAAGAAVVLNNAQLASSDLQAALHRFTHPDVNLVAMSKAAKSLHKSAAATSVTEICEEFFHA